jgi:lysozyme
VKCSEAGIRLIQEFEGYAAEPYEDVGGKLTWGFGHLGKRGEIPPKRISEADATALLCRDLEVAEACIDGLVDVNLSQSQFDALCSFVFNLGCTAFMGSTLLRKINAGDATASDEFRKWCRVGHNEVAGLLRRRLAEQALWDKGESDGNT